MSNFEARLAASQEVLDAARGSELCTECGRPIPAARRAVAPFARRCVECQELLAAEKYHK